MRIVVFGASGRTGRQVVQQAMEQGHQVTAFVRSPRKIGLDGSGIRVCRGDARDAQAAADAIAGQDAVISCLGARGMHQANVLSQMAEQIIAGMERHGVKRIGYLATAGIHGEMAGLAGFATRLLLRASIAGHRRAAEALAASGLDWTIARPLSLTNGRRKGLYLEARQGVPEGKSRISRADVAHFLLRTLTDRLYFGQSVGLSD